MSGTDFTSGSVLVTGAQGFIGSWLVERLLALGAEVSVLRRDQEPDSRFATEGLVEHCSVVDADLLDYESIVRTINEHEVKTVFHLGAQTMVSTANRSPLSTFDSNIRGTYTLLEACRAVGVLTGPVDRVIVASSDKAYGPGNGDPYREGDPLRPDFPYDVSKACSDLLARSYAKTYELPVAVTRLANVYGGGDGNEDRLIPETAIALAAGDRPVIRSDGSPEREYLYVADAVDAYLAVAGSLDDPANRGRAWNAGSGEVFSVREVVERMIETAGVDVEPDVRGSGVPHGEIDRQRLDSGAIRGELGWHPSYSLAEGLEATLQWYRDRAD